jgi:N-methylhydantoinase A
MKISQDAARAAVDTVATPLGLSTEEAALGILRVVTANMARALRVVSVQRGYDPRDYALVPFGGAGPLHSSRLARELGITTVLVPETPGAQSAMGLLMTDIKTDFMRTRIVPVSESDAPALAASFAGLEEQAADWFDAEGVAEDDRRLVRRAELRYHGQNFELPVELPAGPVTAETVAEMLRLFGQAHERVYGYYQEGAPVEAVTFRVEASGVTPQVALHTAGDAGEDPAAALVGTRDLYTDPATGFRPSPVYDRALLRPGNSIAGPAIIEQMDTTTVLLPGDVCRVDSYGNLKIQIGA